MAAGVSAAAAAWSLTKGEDRRNHRGRRRRTGSWRILRPVKNKLKCTNAFLNQPITMDHEISDHGGLLKILLTCPGS